MPKISLIEVIKKWDAVSGFFGLSHTELRELLGMPTGWGIDQKMEVARIWRYGDIEFHFNDNVVWMLYSDHNHMTIGAGLLEIDPWILRRGLNRTDFENALKKESIPYTSRVHEFDECQKVVTTPSGAQFSFIEDSDGYSIGMDSWSIAAKAEQTDADPRHSTSRA